MKHILLILLLATTLATTATAQTGYLPEFQQKWQNAASYTIEVAEAMPEYGYGFKPTEAEMTFGKQLLHIMSNMTWLSRDYLGGGSFDHDLKREDLTKTEIITLLQQAFDHAGKAAAALTPEQLEEKVEFFAGPMTKRQILTLMNDHLTHHRGQLVVYLRLNGIEPPDYRGW
ncbi:MAG: DinB family protein [Bacteroidetes bacterium]|nr:DinB family protein [Bacteroidota bacterium]